MFYYDFQKLRIIGAHHDARYEIFCAENDRILLSFNQIYNNAFAISEIIVVFGIYEITASMPESIEYIYIFIL